MIFGIIIGEDLVFRLSKLHKLMNLMNKENSILRCAITLSRRLLVPLLIITADSMLLPFFFQSVLTTPESVQFQRTKDK